jgi:hypothetical protein
MHSIAALDGVCVCRFRVACRGGLLPYWFLMAYRDLREFIRALEEKGELKRISVEVDPILEITEFADRAVKQGGPAL